MSRMIRRYVLTADSQPQTIIMPRRARVMYAATESIGTAGYQPCLISEVVEDADTKAFDVKHQRTFLVLSVGGTIPDGAAYIGSCSLAVAKSLKSLHIFEVRK